MIIRIHVHKGWELSRLALILATLLFLTACQSEFSIWVIPNSTASALVFGVSTDYHGEQKMSVDSITVFSCDVVREGNYPKQDFAVWSAASKSDNTLTTTNRVYYGKDSDGLKTLRGPEPIKAPGCYIVLSYAKDDKGYMETATTGFNVNSDGQVVEMSKSEYKNLFSK